jgi:hypothetical protein
MNHLPLEKAIKLDKALKKAGVEMETQFVYKYKTHTLRLYDTLSKSFRDIDKVLSFNYDVTYSDDRYDSRIYPAPTLSEMIELLPKALRDYDLNIKFDFFYDKWMCDWFRFETNCIYLLEEDIEDREEFRAPTLLEAVYEALLWCLEKGYIEGKE